MNRKSWLPLMMIAVLAVGCAEDAVDPGQADRVESVAVSPDGTSIAIGETRTMNAVAKNALGKAIQGRTFVWTSSDETIAEVSADGLVTARRQGIVKISASSGGRMGEATVMVVVPTIVDVELDHVAAHLAEGDELQVTATPRSASGAAIEGVGVQWSSSDPTVASVDALGKIIAIRPGITTVTAKVHGVQASTAVTVTAYYSYDLLYTRFTGTLFHEVFRLDIRSPGAAAARLFTENTFGMRPRPSPDGTRVAYVCPGPFLGEPAICVADRDGGNAAAIAWHLGESLGEPTWSPDGSKLAFVRTGPEGNVNRSRIWVMNADGSGRTNLTGEMPGNQTAPAWSPALPDGSHRIAFGSGTNIEQRIWTMRPDGGEKRQITDTVEAFDFGPAWSPDGSTIAFQRIGIGIFGDIWLVNAAGGNERSLLRYALAGIQHSPAWSPDGRLIAFVSAHETYGTGNPVDQVYTAWADGTKLARRTFDAGDKYGPAWLVR